MATDDTGNANAKDGDAKGVNATQPGITANPDNLVGEKIFIRSSAKIGRVVKDEGGDEVDVRLSPDATDATAPVVTVKRDDIVRNAHGG
jgi:hypothetical protein